MFHWSFKALKFNRCLLPSVNLVPSCVTDIKKINPFIPIKKTCSFYFIVLKSADLHNLFSYLFDTTIHTNLFTSTYIWYLSPNIHVCLFTHAWSNIYTMLICIHAHTDMLTPTCVYIIATMCIQEKKSL